MPATTYDVAGSSGIIPSFPGLSLTSGHVRNVFLALSPLSTGRSLLLVRLACFSHAASVQSEPGSNSSIFISLTSHRGGGVIFDKKVWSVNIPTFVGTGPGTAILFRFKPYLSIGGKPMVVAQSSINFPRRSGLAVTRERACPPCEDDGHLGFLPHNLACEHQAMRPHSYSIPNCSLVKDRSTVAATAGPSLST